MNTSFFRPIIQLISVYLCCVIFPIYAHAQESISNIDSTNLVFLNAQSKQLQDFENERIQDSIKQIELENRISGLSTADNVQKAALLLELEALKNQESNRIALKQQKIDSLRHIVKAFPVIPFLDDTLFLIYTKSGSLSAQDRAIVISNKIYELARNYLFSTDSLQLITAENTIDITYGDNIIISISETDALWQNTTKAELASQYKTIISDAIVQYKNETSWKTIGKEIGLAILVILAIGFLLFGIIKLFQFTAQFISKQLHTKLKGVVIKEYVLFSAESQLQICLYLNTLIKWVLILLVLYLALPILFSIFPWTKGFADTLFSYFTTPFFNILKSIWNYLPNLFTIIVIYIVFHYILKGIHYLKTEIETNKLHIPGFYPDWARPTFQIIRVLLYAFMFIVIFPYLPGSDSPVFQGVSVFLGVLFTFGSSGPLSNVIAGLVLTYMRAFKIGDRVKIGDITGDIIEKSILVTRIRTTKNEIISLPNSNVMSSHTVNYSSDSEQNGLILYSTITLGYDVPWKLVHQTLIDAALRTEYVLKEPLPFVLQTSLDDFYVSYQINVYTRESNRQASIYSFLHQNIQDCCNEVGIEILSPHYRAARDGNSTTIPANYLDPEYKAPPFNVHISKPN